MLAVITFERRLSKPTSSAACQLDFLISRSFTWFDLIRFLETQVVLNLSGSVGESVEMSVYETHGHKIGKCQ